MNTTELLFFGGFIVFVVGVLMLDMLVIDRKAHEVSMKEAGAWTAVWVGLALAFSLFLWFHGDMVHGIQSFADLQEVSSRYASHLKLDPGDFEGSLTQYRHYMTISYISGYLIEKTLSVDNLFVMMMIFASFGVSKKEYQHVLNWGVLGAIVMRFVFIFAGAAVIERFKWILLVFGAFLVYSGLKMFFGRKENGPVDVGSHPVVRMLSRVFRVYPKFHGDDFVVHVRKDDNGVAQVVKRCQGGLLYITPLLVTVIFIEFSDLIFAFDSIPAVFSVSLDPYVVFFSNIFALLGLRSLFFLLAGVADRFRYLKTGVCVLLLFIGLKLLLHDFVEIGAVESLVFIVAVLVVSILCSLIPKKKKA